MTGRATVYDVARAAGVSIKTVSRVVNNSSKVSAQTRQRVLEAVADLDYVRGILSVRQCCGELGKSVAPVLLLNG